jgi:hypothetical protein
MGELFTYLAIGFLPAPTLAFLAIRFNVFPLMRKTYFFWTSISLLNFGFLAFLPFPSLLIHSRVLGKFMAFLLPPACAAAAVTLILLAALRVATRTGQISARTGAIPYLLNLAFFVSFVIAADAHKAQLIDKAMSGREPECFYSASFFSSMIHAGGPFQFHAHALFVERGRNFYWSYAKLSFYEGNDRLDRNFPCFK